eukprot:6272890-Prymnesium_polylepis.1
MEWEELTSFIVEALNGGDLTITLPKYRPIEPVQDQTRLRSEQVGILVPPAPIRVPPAPLP